jgi:tRNA-specific 2-thiouridylase
MKILGKKKIMVAMSGGVDSSVAAFLLREKGYEVIGVFMRLFESQGEAEAAARRVCRHLGIKFYPVNLANKFKEEVIDYFIDSYEAGITPNPCVKCNKFIKFGEMFRIMHELQCDYLATGHYIRIEKKFNFLRFKSIMKIYKGEDSTKDQSYFLYNLSQKQLKKIIFPLAKLIKEDIKAIAVREKLPVLKGESQDVCFLNLDGEIAEHNEYLKKHIESNPGPIKTLDGKKVGEHQGLFFYTLGQRRGVEIGGTGPYYVVKRDFDNNILYVSNDNNDPELYSRELEAINVNWISGIPPRMPFSCQATIRYRHKPIDCTIKRLEKNKYLVEFKKAQRAVTAGQSVVFYQDNELLGGGIIS